RLWRAARSLGAGRVDGRPARAALRRVLPFALAAVPWAIGEAWLRAHSAAAARLELGASSLAAAFVHLAQTLAGIEHAAGWLGSWTAARPSAVAFALLVVAAVWLPDPSRVARGPGGAPEPAKLGPAASPGHTSNRSAGRGAGTRARGVRGAVPFALGWLGCFAFPVWPVAYSWSSYHYTLAAVGGAVLVTRAAARITRWPWIALAGFLLWWHAAGVSAPPFTVRGHPRPGTSHLP